MSEFLPTRYTFMSEFSAVRHAFMSKFAPGLSFWRQPLGIKTIKSSPLMRPFVHLTPPNQDGAPEQ